MRTFDWLALIVAVFMVCGDLFAADRDTPAVKAWRAKTQVEKCQAVVASLGVEVHHPNYPNWDSYAITRFPADMAATWYTWLQDEYAKLKTAGKVKDYEVSSLNKNVCIVFVRY